MHFPRYFASLIVPMAVGASILATGWWTLLAPLLLFGLLPLFELLYAGTTENLSEDDERSVRSQRRYDLLLYAMVPIQFGLLALWLVRVSGGGMTPVEWIGTTLSMGIGCGVLGINVGHELGHRRRVFEQRLAKSLLLTSLYMHFFIEHNRGHHARVATEDDPASARYGESVLRFIPRSLAGAWLDAWALERERLEKRGSKVFTWANAMIRYQVTQVAFTAAIGLIFGWVAMLAFMGAAFIGALLLETVNYIEHYGLQRRKLPDGRYERVAPIHSWNSNHPIGRVVLFELTRHSDHHANARRPYQTLRHFDASPQFPTGYPGMMVLAWCPPLWFHVMHARIERFRASGELPAPRVGSLTASGA